VRNLLVALAGSLALATVAHADIQKRDFGNARATVRVELAATSAPEIDPAGILSGLTLLAGGLAVIRGRRKP
jgi:hypothetical protein